MSANGSERVIELLESMKDSLEREIHNLDAKLDRGFEEIALRFDTQSARLERHAGLLQTGNRWISRLNDWSEKIDRALEAKDVQIRDLAKRIEDLERRNGPATQG
jgi:prefoldin subunit 5